MNDKRFAELAAICRRNGISIWRFADAPEEYQGLVEASPDWECVVFLPVGRLDRDGWFWVEDEADSRTLAFLNDIPKRDRLQRYAGDDWGWCTLLVLPDGSRLAFTEESED